MLLFHCWKNGTGEGNRKYLFKEKEDHIEIWSFFVAEGENR